MQFEEVKAALGNVLESFHEKAAQRLRSLPPVGKSSAAAPTSNVQVGGNNGRKGKSKGKPAPPPRQQEQPAYEDYGEDQQAMSAAPPAPPKRPAPPPRTPVRPPPASGAVQVERGKGVCCGGKGKGKSVPQQQQEPEQQEWQHQQQQWGEQQAEQQYQQQQWDEQQYQEEPVQPVAKRAKTEESGTSWPKAAAPPQTSGKVKGTKGGAAAGGAKGGKAGKAGKAAPAAEEAYAAPEPQQPAPPRQPFRSTPIQRAEVEEDGTAAKRQRLAGTDGGYGDSQQHHSAAGFESGKDTTVAGKAAGKQAAGNKGETKGKRPLPSGKSNQSLQTIRNHIDECELIMHAAYEMESYGQAAEAQEEYSRGLRSFMDAAKKMASEAGSDKEGLKQQVEQLLASRAVVLKERLDNAGVTIASLFGPVAKPQAPQKKQGIIGRLLAKDSAHGQESAQQESGHQSQWQEKPAQPEQQAPARIPARPRPSTPQPGKQPAAQQPEQQEQQQQSGDYSQEWQDGGGWNKSQKDWSQGWSQQNDDWSQNRDSWKQKEDWNQSREEWSQRRETPRAAPPTKGAGKNPAAERSKGAASGQRAQQSEGPPSKRPLPQAGGGAADRRPPGPPAGGKAAGKGRPQAGGAAVPSAVAKSSFLPSRG